MMKSENPKNLQTVDFFFVEPSQHAIHERLENWARYVEVRRPGWISPMWKQGKSNGRQWHLPAIRVEVDSLDGHAVEKVVASLPEPFRGIIRWAYVYRYGELQARREFGMTKEYLWNALARSRSMVENRLLQKT